MVTQEETGKTTSVFSEHSKVGLILGDYELFNQSGTTMPSFLKEALLSNGRVIFPGFTPFLDLWQHARQDFLT